MAIIQVPARAIVGKPKLNIANDNTYENVGYEKQSNSFPYKELGTYNLNIINIDGSNMSNANSAKVLWTSVLSASNNPYILKQDNIDKNIVVYEWNNGIYANKLLPTTLGDWHYFVAKITIPKPDINFDYSKTSFGVWQDFRYLKPSLSGSDITFDKYVYSEFGGVSEIPIIEIPSSRIFDKNATESQLLNAISVEPDLSQINESNGGIGRQMVSLRITDADFEFYITNGVVNGKVSTDDLYAIYSPQTFKFYYKDLERASLGSVNEDAKYSLADNELLAEQTKYNGTSIYDQIENSIVSEYNKGKFSVDLSCLYMKYVDSNGNVAYSGTDGKTISVGDIIQPYYYNSVSGDSPVATYEDGSPMCFKVYKSEISTEDSKYITNSVSAIEISKPVPYTIDLPINTTGIERIVELNGVPIEESTTAYAGDIIFIPKSNVGKWTDVSVNGVVYSLETNKVGIGFNGYTFVVTQDMSISFYRYVGGIN